VKGPGKIKALRGFIWTNLDVLLIMVIAAGVLIAEVIGSPRRELIDSVILALLGATAFALLRDRGHRIDFDEVRQLAADAISDRPYQVVWQINEWDLIDREQATTRVTEQLRFTRNDVSTIADWSSGSGRVVRFDGKWRRSEGDQWIDAKTIHRFPIRNGEKVIYSLDEEHCRGDMLEWFVERDSVGRFPTAHESVSIEARTKADHPRVLHIIWPPGSDPTSIELRLKGQPARKLYGKRRDGRIEIQEKVAQLPVGEEVEIGWTW